MNIEIGFSPCPNDTFMFYAMLHGLVDNEGITFTPFIADVEELNLRVLEKNIQASKASYRTIAKSLDNYSLLQSGSALGRGCGPLLIGNGPANINGNEPLNVLIPGENTTANFLLETYYPFLTEKTSVLFSEIEDMLLNDEADLGVIIHENRFTFKEKGLVEIDDLGKRWEDETELPIPLGGIVVQKDLDKTVQQKMGRIIRRSVQYALKHFDETLPFVRKYSQTMSEDVMRKHINLYVNEFSIELGDEGKRAVKELFKRNGIAATW
jgi:1,4-dihydroxy-6-naphthoate synthase